VTAVIDTVERFADWLATAEELHEAHLRTERVAERAGRATDAYEAAEGVTGNTVREWQTQCAGQAAVWASSSGDGPWATVDRTPICAADAVALARGGTDDQRVARHAGEERAVQADLVRDIFGNPFRPVTLDPRWLTSNVVGLARGIYEDGAFERMPLLADALLDAGCEDADILGHCRGGGPHARGCWVVDLVLGRA
jgi:hypothetical protein